MPTELDESVAQLLQMVRSCDIFECVALLSCAGSIREARIYVLPNRVKVFLEKNDGTTRVEETVAGLSCAFEKIASFCNAGHILIDTLTVRTQRPGASCDEFLLPEDEMYLLTLQAWKASLGTLLIATPAPAQHSKLMAEFKKELLALETFQSTIWIKSDKALKEAELTSRLSSEDKSVRFIHLYLRSSPPYGRDGIQHRTADVTSAMSTLFHFLQGSQLLTDTMIVKTNRTKETATAKLSASESEHTDSVYRLTSAFWCACAAICESTENHDLNRQAAQAAREQHIRNLLLAFLQVETDGVTLWNNLPANQKCYVSYEKIDMQKRKLEGLMLGGLDFKNSNFNDALLKRLQAPNTLFSQSSFHRTDLTDSNMVSVDASGADFSDAILCRAKFHKANLRGATFVNANLKGADFKQADLRGADLTNCNAEQAASFKKAIYDDETIVPADFPQLRDLIWKGHGADPYKLLLMQNVIHDNSAPLDFGGFLKLIRVGFDEARVDKALNMLKQDRFQLFVEQNDAAVLGVIKSQTDPNLVYASKLGIEGTFACCTQNFHACGGLRGSLCKHILVLVIGLVRANELDANQAALRVVASKNQTPSLNKDLMTAVFLRYSAAQTGELDWRPTETIPEDYYSF